MTRKIYVDDPESPALSDYRHVRDPEWLRTRGIFLAEGRRVVERLLESSRFATRSILLTETALDSLKDAVDRLGDDIPVYVASLQAVAATSGIRFHQGCVAIGHPGAQQTTSDLLGSIAPGPGFVVVLEDIGNPDNIGSIFRNAYAFGARAVLLSPNCCSPLYRKAIRTSMAATLRLPYAVFQHWPGQMDQLRDSGFAPIALTPCPEAEPLVGALRDRALPARVALMLGHEGAGLSKAVLEGAERKIRIEMADDADSLNVASAAAVAMHCLFTRSAAGKPRGGRPGNKAPTRIGSR